MGIRLPREHGRAVCDVNAVVGENVQVVLDPGERQFDSYLLATPDGTRRVSADETTASLWISDVGMPGQYRLEAGGRQGVSYGFSMNMSPEDNNVQRADIEHATDNSVESGAACPPTRSSCGEPTCSTIRSSTTTPRRSIRSSPRGASA